MRVRIAGRVCSAPATLGRLFHVVPHRETTARTTGAQRAPSTRGPSDPTPWAPQEAPASASGLIRHDEVPLLARYGTSYGLFDEWSCEELHIIAHRRRSGAEPKEYARKLAEQREFNRVPKDVPVLFLEVDVEDASEFEEVLEVRGAAVGEYKVLRAESAVVPNAIAAFLLYLRDDTGKTPHCYFGWTQGNPFVYVVRYILFGEGDTAPVTHEVLREAEPDIERRPNISVGGR